MPSLDRFSDLFPDTIARVTQVKWFAGRDMPREDDVWECSRSGTFLFPSARIYLVASFVR